MCVLVLWNHENLNIIIIHVLIQNYYLALFVFELSCLNTKQNI